ncbi:formyltransferase family protein [Flavobacterium plurextorum]|uniref:formyltransferase family protein n=1 Tax=Flavobacterium plurextorum TaxID=1114867 RepID=UPI0037578CED
MSNYIILSEKSWHKDLLNDLTKSFNDDNWLLINSKIDFNLENVEKFKPTKIFIPHWSHIIPKEIHENYECIVFHMTDLPFGRGGSPLQNLIVRGFKSTKISALRVEEGLDTGGIYLKEPLELNGTAEEIFSRVSLIIRKMIFKIIENKLIASPQFGEVTEFKRRKSEESNIIGLTNLEEVYDYIRMLDCEGYPNAFIETDNLKFEFDKAIFNETEKIITANVRIFKK